MGRLWGERQTARGYYHHQCVSVCVCVCVSLTVCMCETELCTSCVYAVVRGVCVASVCPLYNRIDGFFYTVPRSMYMCQVVNHSSSNALKRLCVCVCSCGLSPDLSYPGKDGGVLPNSF